MEFVQFHPTAFALSDKGTMFLISEAVRGEGAKLVHKDGTTFMEKYDKRLELAPRDVVTRAIYNEMAETNTQNVYLDATHISEEKFEKRFPTIYGTCKEYNINPSKNYIPVSPSAHYFMGGIKTEVNGTTSLDGLYAIGEVACTGLHGANRLASNSILECAVTAYELVNLLKKKDLNNNFEEDEEIKKTISFYDNAFSNKLNEDYSSLIAEIKQLMWNNVGIIRNKEKLYAAKEEIEELKKNFDGAYKCPNRAGYEVRNMLTVANLIVDFAINRRESRGAHYREDYPQRDMSAQSQQTSKDTVMKG